MTDFQKQHDELRAGVTKAVNKWKKAAKGKDKTDALTRVVQASRRLAEFEIRNQAIREES